MPRAGRSARAAQGGTPCAVWIPLPPPTRGLNWRGMRMPCEDEEWHFATA